MFYIYTMISICLAYTFSVYITFDMYIGVYTLIMQPMYMENVREIYA